MCGIAGAIGWKEPEAARLAVEAMKRALAHRGPDGEGTWLSETAPIALGHRRLSIIDLSHAADQPLRSSDGRYVIAFNGELYNYRELRRECEILGSVFATQSDTEVILESYRHWGENMLSRFKGMFAFALFDSASHTVLLARDPFGIKPLYYGVLDGVLYFASEPKALRSVDARFGEIDEVTEKLFVDSAYLERGDWTFFRRIKRFPHAHFARFKANQEIGPLFFQRYWEPDEKPLKIGYEDAVAELRRLLRRSVELHLRSDVPVGSCLSGGLDSSAIVCFGSAMLPPGKQFRTFTTRYPEHPEIDESQWAQTVVDYANASPTYIEPTFQNFVADFDHLIEAQDEPFGSTSIYAQYAIFQGIAKTDVRVVLDGQGADEQLAGYHGFIPEYLTRLLTENRSLRYLDAWLSFYAAGGNFAFGRRAFFDGLLRRAKGAKSMNGRPFGAWRLDELEARLKALQLPADSFEQVLVNLVVEQNLPQLLRYEDRNSMAHSIESRVPFLEPELVTFILALPAAYKLRRGWTKSVLRDALREIIPDDVRVRRDKLGFPAPELAWLKRGFGIDAAGIGGAEWRKLVTARWRTGLARGANVA